MKSRAYNHPYSAYLPLSVLLQIPLFIPLYSDLPNGPRPHHPLLSSNKSARSGAEGTACAVTGSHSLRQTHSSVHLIGPEWRQKWHPMDTGRLVIKLQAFVLLSIFSAGFAQSFFFSASPFPEGRKRKLKQIQLFADSLLCSFYIKPSVYLINCKKKKNGRWYLRCIFFFCMIAIFLIRFHVLNQGNT